MDTRTWPLSAATTQLLLDLKVDGAGVTATRTVSRLSIKELILRGHLKITDFTPRRLRSTVIRVTSVPGGAPLPVPLATLASELGPADGTDLSKLISGAVKRNNKLFIKLLKEYGLAELHRLGLTEVHERRVLGLFRTTHHRVTPQGQLASEQARAAIARAEALPALAARDPLAGAQEATELGIFVLLTPEGLSEAAKLAHRTHAVRRQGDAMTAVPLVAVAGFDVLGACDAAFGGLLEIVGGLDGSLDASVEAAIDAMTGSIDGGINAAVSAGGGESGGGDGGGDGGGGGCGGGCGGS